MLTTQKLHERKKAKKPQSQQPTSTPSGESVGGVGFRPAKLTHP
jgi:hypothetical protein